MQRQVNTEEQFIRVMLSGRKPKNRRNSDQLMRKIGKSIGTGGGLFSMGSRRNFIRDNRTCYRRAVVKALVLKNKGPDWSEKRQKHANYIQREGAGKDGEQGVAYGSKSDKLDVHDFINRGQDDAHEFRFMLSAEDSGKLDLTEFTRTLMKSLEDDLGTKLDWMAANHHNTESPHTHIVLRGSDENGRTLILDRDMISHGIRNKARAIVTRELGERTEHEIKDEIKHSVHKNRAVQIDFEIEKRLGSDRIYGLQNGPEVQGVDVRKSDQEKRLKFLETLGLSEKITQTEWKLKEGFIEQLKEMGIQGDIIKMMHRDIKIHEQNCVVYKKEIHGHKELSGVVIKRGVSNEMTDKEFLVIQAQDRRYYYVDLDRYSERSKVKIGDSVAVSMTEQQPWVKKSDLNLAAFAKIHNGIYDPIKHSEWAKSIGIGHEDYVKVHVGRIEFLEKLDLAKKSGDGQWKLKPDFLKKLKDFEDEQKQKFIPRVSVRPVSIKQEQGVKQGIGKR